MPPFECPGLCHLVYFCTSILSVVIYIASDDCRRPFSLLMFFNFFVYTVIKCLVEGHYSNPAHFDRECLTHLSSRLKMWESAVEVGVSLFTICGLDPI